METQPVPAPARGGRYLLFRVARQDFAILANRVRAILPIHELVMLEGEYANSQAAIYGFASMNGSQFLVVDLRRRLGLQRGSQGRSPSIVVLDVTGSARPVGFVADRISEVVTVHERDFRNRKIFIAGRLRRVLDGDQLLMEQPEPCVEQ